MNYNNPDFVKYLVSTIYGLDINKMKNFTVLKDKCTFQESETNRSEVSLTLVKDFISKLKELGCKDKSKQRIGFIIDSDIVMYFLSSYYIEYRLFCNFVKLLNHHNIGVDLITDKNIITMIPEELKTLDIKLFFSIKNKDSNPIELNIKNSIEDYYSETPTTIRCIADTPNGTKGLIEANIPKAKKVLLLHAQKLLNFPLNDNIKDKNDEVFSFVELIQDVDFKIATTSEVLKEKLQDIIPDKDYIVVEELGYTVEDAEEHFYPQRDFQSKSILIKYTGADDLEYCLKAIKPLNYFVTVLIDDDNDKQLVDYFMQNNNYENYKVRKSSSYKLLKDNYNIAIDFSEEITVPYECQVMCNFDLTGENYLPTDKTNAIIIIKNLLMSAQSTYGLIEDNSSFCPKHSVEDCDCKSLKASVI